MLKVVKALGLYLEVAAGIHRKPVDDHLTEYTVVLIGFQERAYGTVTPPQAKITIDGFEAWTQQTGRNDKDIGEDIDNANVYDPQ